MLGSMLKEGLILHSWQHDVQNLTTLLHVNMKKLFLWKKMVVGSEGHEERRKEEIL